MALDKDALFIGDAMFSRAGCLWLPFFPIKAGGRMVVTYNEVLFEPVLHWKYFARQLAIPISDIEGVEVGRSTIGFSIMEIVTVGRTLTIYLKSGGEYQFRSMNAEGLAMAINTALTERKG